MLPDSMRDWDERSIRKAKSAKPARAPDKERPTIRATTSVELGDVVSNLRRSLAIRQADLAARAGVGRQWIVALEQGKPSLEVALVMRTLEALGLELQVRPIDPIPPWIKRSMTEAKAAAAAKADRQRARRRTRREAERLRRLWENTPKTQVDLE